MNEENITRQEFEDHFVDYDFFNRCCDIEMSRKISQALITLTPRQERIIRLRFGIGCHPHNLREIGEKFGVTRESIR